MLYQTSYLHNLVVYQPHTYSYNHVHFSLSPSWLYEVPWGLRKLLNFIRTEYSDPEIIVTENGVADHTGSLDDQFRIKYHTSYLDSLLQGKLHNHIRLLSV